VLRGGSWQNAGVNCRSGNRNANDPARRNENVGLRVVRPRSSARESDDRERNRPLSCPSARLLAGGKNSTWEVRCW
jgi:hypothetical protein